MMIKRPNLVVLIMASIELELLLLRKMCRSFELLSRTTDYPGLKSNKSSKTSKKSNCLLIKSFAGLMKLRRMSIMKNPCWIEIGQNKRLPLQEWWKRDWKKIQSFLKSSFSRMKLSSESSKIVYVAMFTWDVRNMKRSCLKMWTVPSSMVEMV